MTPEIIPPPIDMQEAFRLLSWQDLVNLLSSKFGYNPFTMKIEEYIAEHKFTVDTINSFRNQKPRG